MWQVFYRRRTERDVAIKIATTVSRSVLDSLNELGFLLTFPSANDGRWI